MTGALSPVKGQVCGGDRRAAVLRRPIILACSFFTSRRNWCWCRWRLVRGGREPNRLPPPSPSRNPPPPPPKPPPKPPPSRRGGRPRRSLPVAPVAAIRAAVTAPRSRHGHPGCASGSRASRPAHRRERSGSGGCRWKSHLPLHLGHGCVRRVDVEELVMRAAVLLDLVGGGLETPIFGLTDLAAKLFDDGLVGS